MAIDYDAHAQAIAALFNATATIYSVQSKDAFTGASPNIDSRKADLLTPLYTDVPCYVEFENADAVSGDLPLANQRITFICPEGYEIAEGATIDATKNDYTRRFRAAGVADHLGSHQEIALEAITYAKGG